MDEKITTTELKSKRTLNSKHFLLEDGKIKGDFHVGHIHYNDKLGGTGLRSIDWTLSFDEVKRGWGFQYHSFHPFLPEYADGWVEFRDLFDDKDQTIKYKAHASHIKGRLVTPSDIGLEKETSVNCVIYDDAFGKGKDYVLYFSRSALKKVVRIREAFKGTVEQRFTWDIDFPKEYSKEKKVKRVKDKDEYELDITQDKTFDSDRITKIGNDKGDGKEWHTYLRTFKAWDSGNGTEQKYQIVNVEYKATDKTITKIVPALFLTESVGDVFTDTTTTYYPFDDNGVYVANTWQTAHDATTGTLRGGNVRYIQSFTQNSPTIERGFFTFDTSALDDDANITSASLVLESAGKSDSAQGITNEWDVSIFNSSHTDTVVADDYDQAGTTLWSSKLNYSDWAADGSDVTFTLNSTGLAGISKTGKTKISIREASHDAANSIHNPDINQVYVAFDDSGVAGTDSDPYLSVTYTTSSGPAKLKTWNGTAAANVKTINGTAISSVKSINGVV